MTAKRVIQPLLPNKRPARNTNKFSRTMGTGPMGIERYAPAAVKAAKSEAYYT
ncbi:MAG: hypothetical protein QME06_06695 [Desulfobacterales bacterium]|nr:hypothetical protein [Desulfobacterales bacterium]